MRHILTSMADALFPRLCPVCGCSMASGERLMCTRCMAHAPRAGMHLRPDNSIVARIARPGLRLELAAAWLDYVRDSPYARVVLDAKFNNMPRLAREAGRIFAREMQADGVPALGDIDVLLPVPLHWRRLLRRGYNQSEELAQGLADVLAVPVGDNLRATRAHSTQTRRSAEERRRNVSGIIAVKHPEELAGLHVAVVDDVVTTGSTMADALRAITEAAQPRALSVLALAAVPADAWRFPAPPKMKNEELKIKN